MPQLDDFGFEVGSRRRRSGCVDHGVFEIFEFGVVVGVEIEIFKIADTNTFGQFGYGNRVAVSGKPSKLSGLFLESFGSAPKRVVDRSRRRRQSSLQTCKGTPHNDTAALVCAVLHLGSLVHSVPDVVRYFLVQLVFER